MRNLFYRARSAEGNGSSGDKWPLLFVMFVVAGAIAVAWLAGAPGVGAFALIVQAVPRLVAVVFG